MTTKKITLNELRSIVKQIIKEEMSLKESFVLGVYNDPRYGLSVDAFANMEDFNQKLQSNNWEKVNTLTNVDYKDIKSAMKMLKIKYNIE
jgi:predicted solute-binding protein